MSKTTFPLSKVKVRIQTTNRPPDLATTRFDFRGPKELKSKIEAIARRRWPTAGTHFADLQSSEILADSKPVAHFVIEPANDGGAAA